MFRNINIYFKINNKYVLNIMLQLGLRLSFLCYMKSEILS